MTRPPHVCQGLWFIIASRAKGGRVLWALVGSACFSLEMRAYLACAYSTRVSLCRSWQRWRWNGGRTPCSSNPLPPYDKESAEGSNWVSQGGESESGQMVLKKVKWTYFDAYLCQTMWNNAKKSMKRLKRPNSLFLQGEVSSAVLKTWKTRETKTRITQNFQILNHIHWNDALIYLKLDIYI